MSTGHYAGGEVRKISSPDHFYWSGLDMLVVEHTDPNTNPIFVGAYGFAVMVVL